MSYVELSSSTLTYINSHGNLLIEGTETKWQIQEISICDVRVMRGAYVKSDHHLVIAKVKLKLCRNTKPSAKLRKMYDVSKLKDPRVCKGFQLEIRNRFQQLSDEENDISKN